MEDFLIYNILALYMKGKFMASELPSSNIEDYILYLMFSHTPFSTDTLGTVNT